MRPKLQPFANAAANCDSMRFCESRTCDPSQVTCLRITSMRVGTAAFVLLQPSHAFSLAGSLLAAGLVVLLPRVLFHCGSCGCPTPTRAHLQFLDWSCTSLHSLSPASSASSAPLVLLLRASPAADPCTLTLLFSALSPAAWTKSAESWSHALQYTSAANIASHREVTGSCSREQTGQGN